MLPFIQPRVKPGLDQSVIGSKFFVHWSQFQRVTQREDRVQLTPQEVQIKSQGWWGALKGKRGGDSRERGNSIPELSLKPRVTSLARPLVAAAGKHRGPPLGSSRAGPPPCPTNDSHQQPAGKRLQEQFLKNF